MTAKDNITLPREVVQGALDALEWAWGCEHMRAKKREAITALRTALAAEPTKQESVAWLSRDEARLALWKAINSREFGNPTDDKLILDHLRQQGLWIGKVTSPALAAEQPVPTDKDSLTVQSRLDAESFREERDEARALLNGVLQDIEALRRDAEQPKPEPVAWMFVNLDGECEQIEYGTPPTDDDSITPLYIAPPSTHPGYVIGSHWLETAYSRVCAGEAEADVLRDCGWKRVDDAEALRRDAERYRYLRSRDPKEVFNKSGKAAGVWIDWEDDLSGLQLLTGDDADAAIDAAMENKP